MLEYLSTYVRLFFCLLVSIGLHLGVILLDATPGAVATLSSREPLSVSLVDLPIASAPVQKEVALNSPPPSTPAPQSTPLSKPDKPPRQSAKTVTAAPTKPEPLPEPLPELEQKMLEPLVCVVAQEIDAEISESAEEGISEVADEAPAPTESKANASTQEETSVGAAQATPEQTVEGIRELQQVDAVPAYSDNPKPTYPRIAREKHWEGVVWLEVDVSEDGTLSDLRIDRSCGYAVLDRSARRAVRRWRFTPARKAGYAVASKVRVPICFQLENH